LSDSRITKVINCIAIADIEKCQENPELAKWVNSDIPMLVSKICLNKSLYFCHISTDAVFGDNRKFDNETEETKPMTIYGKTKLEGEIGVMSTNDKSVINRVNFVGYSNKKSSLVNYFVDSFLRNERVLGYSNVYFTPLHASNTARVVLEMMDKGYKGLWHVVGSKRISKYSFGKRLFKKIGFNAHQLEKNKLVLDKNGIQRNLDLSLSNSKLIKSGIFPQKLSDTLNDIKLEVEQLIGD
jgi:dTDP-4-dehydrorhamnose reductase